MKRICMLILALSLAFATAATAIGCNKQETAVSVNEATLYDFEDYDRNFALMRVMAYFGAVNVNRDEKYVKNGKMSALLQPLGYHSTMVGNVFTPTLKPECCLYIPFSSNKYDFDYTDATVLQDVRLAMYNDEETALSVYVSLIFERNAQTVSEPVACTLKPGWNEVIYRLDHDVLAINHDLSACYGLALGFDRVGSRDLADAPNVYLDDVRLRLTDPVTPKNLVTLEENEICDFEKAYQKYTVTSFSFDKAMRPDLEIVTAADYGLTAPSGRKVLRAVLKPVDAIDGTIYDQIYLTQSLIDAVGFSALGDDAYFCFDFYNDTELTMDLSVTFLDTKNSGYKVARHLYANAKQWTPYRIRLADVDALWGNAEDRTYRDNPGPIRIEWSEFTDGERVVYMDNFRIER